MPEIVLHNGMIAIVDEADFHALSQFSWTATKSGCSGEKWYASRIVQLADGSWRQCYMHRQILAVEQGEIADHKDGDGLNNRRSNLRTATKAQNNANRGGYSPSSGYRGVYSQNGKFRAQISSGNKNRHLGTYANPEDAARAYDAAAHKQFGEFARLNFPRRRAA